MLLPVLLAAWLTFSASPIVGPPLDQVATFELPEQGPGFFKQVGTGCKVTCTMTDKDGHSWQDGK